MDSQTNEQRSSGEKVGEIVIKAELHGIREAFERYFIERYLCTQCSFARNPVRYVDSVVETAWQAFQAGFKFAKGEK
jgi:ribosomal protein S12 methylthiotransferase accessory factor YcaO